MVRGVHFMAWHRDMWNYHPSLPMKRLRMLDDVVAMGGTTLLWSCLGSGGIGLPYLDKEANEPVPGRLRFYGHLNDREFCAACAARGVTAFAVLWNAQLWEFPAEFGDDESELLALNIPRGVGTAGWLGLSELSRDRYPKLYRPMGDFFPDGLRDLEGASIADYLEEFKQVSLDGEDILSGWLMVPGHTHRCHTPCGSDRAYIAYAKRQIELMVDAGAGGILIDEVEAHNNGLRTHGGCFCRDCVAGFRRYLRAHPPEEAARLGLDLDTFDYRAFLKGRGYTDADLLRSSGERFWDVPLHRAYVGYVYDTIDRTIAELADHTRDYSARARGAPVPVSGNLYNCLPDRAPLRKHLDVLSGEKTGLAVRQDGWYRFARAFLGGKPACLIEDPSQHILDIAEDLKDGRADAYTLFMLEPLAQGVAMAVPYGAWLINAAEDALYPDMRVAAAMGRWLTEHEDLFAAEPVADIAVVYDQRAARERFVFHDKERDREAATAFHVLSQHLCDNGCMYRVVYAGDDDPLTDERLRPYARVLLPDCDGLAEPDIAALARWVAAGGEARVVGRPHDALAAHGHFDGPTDTAVVAWLRAGPSLARLAAGRGIGYGLHKLGGAGGYALHVVNYNLDRATRTVARQGEVAFELAWQPRFFRAASFPGPDAAVELAGRTLVLRDVGIYTVVRLSAP
jgi:hypothetical protein